MPFELFIALRYLLARRRQAFISVISMISTLGVTVGVMALVIALAMMTGVQGEMRDRLLDSTAHVYVWKDGGISDYQDEVKRLLAIDGVTGAGPAIIGKALIDSQGVQNVISIKGIDPVLERQVTEIERTMQQGSVDGLTVTPGGVPGIVIGEQLAAALTVRLGDTVNLVTPKNTLTPSGMIPTARTRAARVVGIFKLGLLEFDSSWGFVTLDFAEQLTGRGPELLQLRVADAFAAPAIAERIPRELGEGYVAQDWQDINQSLFSALYMEKLLVSFAISLIVIVAALQIVASLILMVMEKSRDIGILKTMGTSPRRISLIFMMQGLVIGVVGTVVGGALSLALCWVLNTYRVVRIPMDVYQVSYIPFIVRPQDFIIVIASAIVICFLATIYPSRQASKLDPVQALRFE
jgi:lipoprotein-releasing system permease protein